MLLLYVEQVGLAPRRLGHEVLVRHEAKALLLKLVQLLSCKVDSSESHPVPFKLLLDLFKVNELSILRFELTCVGGLSLVRVELLARFDALARLEVLDGASCRRSSADATSSFHHVSYQLEVLRQVLLCHLQ